MGNRGFTLIELMLALVISSIIMMAVYATYNSQQKSLVVEDQVVAMQQNLRAGMLNLQREVKMMGCNPNGAAITGANPAIYDAGATVFSFRMNITGGETDGSDNDGDSLSDETDANGNFLEWFDNDTGDEGEDITYQLVDFNGDGNEDELVRDDINKLIPPTQNPVAENIEAIGFAYAFDADLDGELDTTASGSIIWAVDNDPLDFFDELDVNLDTNNNGIIDIGDNTAGTGIPSVGFDRIRAVRIWILARSDREDPDYVNNHIYVVSNQRINPAAQGTDGEDNDGDTFIDEADEQDKELCRMRLLMTTVRCLNMNL